jgi:streptogramin lyase
MAWYTPFGYSTQRPLAWAQGDFNEGSCTYDNEKLWSAGNMGNAEVVLMDGDTGVVEETVIIPNVIGWAGLYGGAVDGLGNFWTVDHNWSGLSTLIFVDREQFTYDTWPVTGDVHYGLAVDSEGRPWLCGSGGFSRFDPQNEQWTHIPPVNPGSALGGCMEDANGVIWNSAYPNATLVGVDTDTVQVVQMINIPAYVHGVSIDFQGNIWGVEFGGSNAYRVNPDTLQIDTVGGLVGAYTYSDMTGFALSAAGVPSN